MHKAAVQGLRRQPGHGLRPDPSLWKLDVIRGRLLVLLGVWWRCAEEVTQMLGGQLHDEAARSPEQKRVVDQGRELVDGFAQALLRPKLAQQGHYLPHHEKGV